MAFLKSRRGAVVVTVLVILFSVVFGAHRSLPSLRRDAREVFETGAYGDGHSVKGALEARRATCANLYTVASRYLPADNANLTDLYDLFSIKGERDCTTVSGWVMEEIGRVPEEGDHFVYENLDVTVTRVDHRRVLEIRVVVLPQEDTGDKDRK